MILEKKVTEYIVGLYQKGLYRKAGPYLQNPRLNFSSNDYLSLSTHPQVIEAAQSALQKYGCGSGASRLVSTSHPLHEHLDDVVAGLVPKKWQSILLSSGFAANLAFFDLFRAVKISLEIYIDHRAHSSLIYAARNSGFPVFFFRRNNFNGLGEKLSRSTSELRIVVSEALHSMDGDFENVRGLAELCKSVKNTFVYIDESHSTGLVQSVFWSFSSSVTACLAPYLLGVMSGCGKALGSCGGLLLLPQFLTELAFQTARPLIYSTALPPATVASVTESLRVLCSSEGQSLRRRLQQQLKQFYELVLQLETAICRNFRIKIETANGQTDELSLSPIVSVYPVDSIDLFELKELLRADSIAVGYMRPPTVPKGTERFRLSFNLSNEPSEFPHFLGYFTTAGGKSK